jgi:hypothetical protein
MLKKEIWDRREVGKRSESFKRVSITLRGSALTFRRHKKKTKLFAWSL